MQRVAPVFVEQLVGQSVGNYRTEQLLGHGQLSAVYLARQHNALRRVMLTIFMLPSWCEGARWGFFMDRFSQVASTLVTLKHPHILPTYDFGEVYSHPYLVTAFKEGVSLASILKEQKRYTPAQVLYVLKQIVDALDHMHEKGLVHGSLRTSGILLDSQRSVLMSGFGLAHMLEARDLISISRPLSHLYSLADTLLYSPGYVAPEVVEGAPADARSDIYSLGVVLYELLCGKLPFSGDDWTAVALQRTKQSAPPLHEVYPEAPAALDFVIQRALDRDPERRFQSAARLSQAFQGAISVLTGAENAALEQTGERLFDVSQRPTLHWFEAESSPYILWNPPVPPTDAVPILGVASAPVRDVTPPTIPPDTSQSIQAVELQPAPASPIESAKTAEQQLASASPIESVQTAEQQPAPAPSIESAKTAEQQLAPSIEEVQTAQQRPVPASPLLSVGAPLNFRPSARPGEFSSKVTEQNQQVAQSVADLSKKVAAPTPKKQRVSRRAVLIVSGGVVAASGLAAAGGFAYLRFIKPMKQHGKSMPNNGAPAQQKKGVVGSTGQAVNATSNFTNPADNKASLLIRLPGGQFVAFESACTHQGVTVKYDAATQKLVCPLHGSVFDPANNGAVLKGPAAQPLPAVAIHVQADGSITV